MDFEEYNLPPAPGNAETEANVQGRHALPAAKGFGHLWRKELRARVVTSSPAEAVLDFWRRELESLWPEAGTFHHPPGGLRRGQVAGIDLGIGWATLSSGVVVEHSGPTLLTLRTPEGHMFAGSIQFDVSQEPGAVVTRVIMDFRANDPLYELGLMLGGHRIEERFWAQMLWNLAAHYGQRPTVQLIRRRLDRRHQWRNAMNIRHNAGIRSGVLRVRRLWFHLWSRE